MAQPASTLVTYARNHLAQWQISGCTLIYTAKCPASFVTGSSSMSAAWTNTQRKSTRSASCHNTIASWKAALSGLGHRSRASDTSDTNIEVYLGIGVRNAKTHSLLLKNFSDTTRSTTRTTYHLRPNGVVADAERSSSNLTQLMEHTRIHTENSYECDECNWRFTLISELTIHGSEFNDTREHACHWCTRYFQTPELLLQHRNREHNFECSMCNDAFPSEDQLTAHQVVKYGKPITEVDEQ